VKKQTVLRSLGLQNYLEVWQNMQRFTSERLADSADEIWITEHPAVFTQGLNGKPQHLLQTSAIPLISTDRGGQITFHGPGQLIIYLLLDIKRLKFSPRQIVNILESAVIQTLRQYGIIATLQNGAPGVYIQNKKIASLGLRIKNNCCYHGLSINNNMDLVPFKFINPCGYPGLEVTQLADLGIDIKNHELAVPIVQQITTAIEA
jgi:lipoyl(octanoyl) transferase